MFVRCKRRFKDGKEHRYWSVVENVRVDGGRVVQRQVLYLGEINDSQRAAWCRSIEVLEGASRSRQVALFPEDREAPELECEVVQVQLAELTLHDPRQWGACWLALTLCREMFPLKPTAVPPPERSASGGSVVVAARSARLRRSGSPNYGPSRERRRRRGGASFRRSERASCRRAGCGARRSAGACGSTVGRCA